MYNIHMDTRSPTPDLLCPIWKYPPGDIPYPIPSPAVYGRYSHL